MIGNDDKKIIVFHGRLSSAETSGFVKNIKENFKDVVAVNYDYREGFDKCVESIDQQIKNVVYGMMVGISLGGYFARYFANQYQAELVMVNPSLTYFGEMEEDNVDISIAVILGQKDDVVDPQYAIDLYDGRARIVVVPDGDHRMKDHYPLINKEISKNLTSVFGS